MVCKTVLLEFEWVMRGFYEFPRKVRQVKPGEGGWYVEG
jgi:hypothetical protein